MTATTSIYWVLSMCSGRIVRLLPDHPPPYLYVEVLIPTVIVFGESALGRWLRLNEVIRVDPNPIGLVFSWEEEKTTLACREAMWGQRQVANCKPVKSSPGPNLPAAWPWVSSVHCLSHPSIIFCYGSPTKWIQCVSGLILITYFDFSVTFYYQYHCYSHFIIAR